MASTSKRSLLEGLRHAVHGLRAPFACRSTLAPEQPVTVCFPDNTQIAVLRARDTFEQQRLLRPLVERCTVAAFGMGRKTRYDRNIRDASRSRLKVAPFQSFTSTPLRQAYLNRSVESWRHICPTRSPQSIRGQEQFIRLNQQSALTFVPPTQRSGFSAVSTPG